MGAHLLLRSLSGLMLAPQTYSRYSFSTTYSPLAFSTSAYREKISKAGPKQAKIASGPSFWAQPDYWHWLLANRRLLTEPRACAGKIGIFAVEIPLGALKKAQTPNPKGENL